MCFLCAFQETRHSIYALRLVHTRFIRAMGLSGGTSNIFFSSKRKGKILPITRHEGPEGEYTFSSTLSFTSALGRGGWSIPLPGLFTFGEGSRYPSYRLLGGTKSQSGRALKVSPHRDSIPGPSSPYRVFFSSMEAYVLNYS